MGVTEDSRLSIYEAAAASAGLLGAVLWWFVYLRGSGDVASLVIISSLLHFTMLYDGCETRSVLALVVGKPTCFVIHRTTRFCCQRRCQRPWHKFVEWLLCAMSCIVPPFHSRIVSRVIKSVSPKRSSPRHCISRWHRIWMRWCIMILPIWISEETDASLCYSWCGQVGLLGSTECARSSGYWTCLY